MVDQAPQEAPKLETPESKSDTQKAETLSSFFKNPEIAKKIEENLNVHNNPQINENFIKFLTNNPDKAKILNSFLEKNLTNQEKCKKTINSMIEKSIGELKVSNENTISTTEAIKNINNKQENIDTAKDKVDTANENAEVVNKLFEETEQAYKNIPVDPTTKAKIDQESSNQDPKEAANISQRIRQKLPHLNDNEVTTYTNNYLKYKSASKYIQEDGKEGSTFLLSFKKLEKSLDISNGRGPEPFLTRNLKTTSKEIFNKETGNDNLIKHVEDKKQQHSSDYQKVFKEQEGLSNTDIFTNYGKFLPSKEQITFATLLQKETDKHHLSPEEQQTKTEIQSKLKAYQESIQEKTKDSMEQASILGPIMGIADYMDMDIGNKFNYNTSNDIQITNNILSIKGEIENKPFVLKNDLSKPSKLQTSDYLHKHNEKEIGIGSNNMQDTQFILPGEADIWQKIQETCKQEYEKIIQDKSIETPDQYQEKIQETLCNTIKTMYNYKDLVKVRMEKQMQKDVLAQDTINIFKDTILQGKELPKQIQRENTPPKIFEFLSNLDYSLENFSEEEREERSKAIESFKRIVEGAKDPQKREKNTVSIIKNISENTLENTKDIFTKGEGKEPTLFGFFNMLEIEGKKTEKGTMYNAKQFLNMMQENTKASPNEKSYENIAENWNKKNAEKDMIEKRPKDEA